jgi:EAL domain-containing protein (putative c-di-GMP-specific phosphodiesterase class I)
MDAIEKYGLHLNVNIIQKLATTYDIKTVAEYVSNESIYQEVRAIGIDFSQGYYISEPKTP